MQKQNSTNMSLFTTVSQHEARWFIFDCIGICLALMALVFVLMKTSMRESTAPGTKSPCRTSSMLADVDDMIRKLDGPPVFFVAGGLALAARDTGSGKYSCNHYASNDSNGMVSNFPQTLAWALWRRARCAFVSLCSLGGTDVIMLQHIKTVFVDRRCGKVVITHQKGETQSKLHVCFSKADAAKKYGESLELLICNLKVKGFAVCGNNKLCSDRRYPQVLNK